MSFKQIWDKSGRWWDKQVGGPIRDALNPEELDSSGQRQKAMDALNNIPSIGANSDLLGSIDTEKLNRYADNGYGQDWINTMFELNTDSIAKQRADALKKTRAINLTTGLSGNKFATRARDQINFSGARAEGKILGGIMSKNNDVKSRAADTVSALNDKNVAYKDYVDSLNEQFKWAREKIINGVSMNDILSEYARKRQNAESKAGIIYSLAGSVPFIGDFLKSMKKDVIEQ